MRRFLDWLRGGPKLRNRPGGMAWICGVIGDGTGAEQLNNRVVKTIRLAASGKWCVEPSQHFIAERDFMWDGVWYSLGDRVGVKAIVDDCLEPWKNAGVSDEEVRNLYEPDRLIARPATASAIRGH